MSLKFNLEIEIKEGKLRKKDKVSKNNVNI